MKEIFNNETVHFGLPQKEIDKENSAFLAASIVKYALRRSQINEAQLSEAEKVKIEQTKQASHKYFSNKFDRLRITKPSLHPIPEVIIAESGIFKDHNARRKGYYDAISNFIVTSTTPDRYDLLDTATTLAHEASHATTQHQARFTWQRQNDEKYLQKRFVQRVGLGREANFYDNRKKEKRSHSFMRGLENGLAIMDQVDIYYQYLKDIFPKEAKRKTKWKKDSLFNAKILLPLEYSEYGQIPTNKIEPFIELQPVKLPLLKKDIFQTPEFGVQQFKFFLLTREICRTIGYSITAYNHERVDDEQMIQKGRDLLDTDRYTNTTNGLKTLVSVFGKETAWKIFHLSDDFQNTDEAMTAVRATQQKLGLYTPIKKK
jgi:hypothetical protein